MPEKGALLHKLVESDAEPCPCLGGLEGVPVLLQEVVGLFPLLLLRPREERQQPWKGARVPRHRGASVTQEVDHKGEGLLRVGVLCLEQTLLLALQARGEEVKVTEEARSLQRREVSQQAEHLPEGDQPGFLGRGDVEVPSAFGAPNSLVFPEWRS